MYVRLFPGGLSVSGQQEPLVTAAWDQNQAASEEGLPQPAIVISVHCPAHGRKGQVPVNTWHKLPGRDSEDQELKVSTTFPGSRRASPKAVSWTSDEEFLPERGG